jgi:hypothetical protein
MRANAAGEQLDVGTIKGQWRKVYEAKLTQILIGHAAIRNGLNPTAIGTRSLSNWSKRAAFELYDSQITSHG